MNGVLTLFAAEAFLEGGAVTDILLEPLTGDFESSLARILTCLPPNQDVSDVKRGSGVLA